MAEPNHFLASLSPADLARLRPAMKLETLVLNDLIAEPGQTMSHAWLPISSILSVFTVMADGRLRVRLYRCMAPALRRPGLAAWPSQPRRRGDGATGDLARVPRRAAERGTRSGGGSGTAVGAPWGGPLRACSQKTGVNSGKDAITSPPPTGAGCRGGGLGV